jgi:hypothetical protein
MTLAFFAWLHRADHPIGHQYSDAVFLLASQEGMKQLLAAIKAFPQSPYPRGHDSKP